MDESRKQFEEWITKETGFDLWRTEYPMTEWDEQQYKCQKTNLAWIAWQASRAAIEIEIPGKMVIIGFEEVDKQLSSINTGMAVVESAIRAAGIKVKE